MSEYYLEMRGINKDFSGVNVLKNIDLKVAKGEIHALCGENGAGKSTLMKILSGVYPHGSYSGTIHIDSRELKFRSIRDSEKAGISIIYQELALVKQLTVGENIFLGNEIAKNGIINDGESYMRTREVLDEIGLAVSPLALVRNLGIGMQQMVEIAKAVCKKANILVFDEPTAALTENETKSLLALLKRFRDRGVTCIYISHKLNEIFEIADTITILRDGEVVLTRPTAEMDEDQVITHMVGRELTQRYPKERHVPGKVVLEVRNWNLKNSEQPDRGLLSDINFDVREGEILGIAGLMGSGRTELALSLIGYYRGQVTGQMSMDKKPLEIHSISDAIHKGISYLSEDRARYGLNLTMNIRENITLASLEKIATYGVVNQGLDYQSSVESVDKLKIKLASLEQKAKSLSGGNQQKVVLGKWLFTQPRILILDEPTRGIDVGAKREIYIVMNQLINQGVCVVMISSDLPEVLGMSDRILVMRGGRIAGELFHEEATQESVMRCATGGR